MDDKQRLTPEERQDLVAYLDGELEETVARKISTKIERSATARREVELLRQTWEMLDFLPMPEAPTTFSQHTIQMVAVADRARDEIGRTIRELGRNLSFLGLWITVIVGAFGAGLFAMRLAPDPNRDLAADLPIIERFHEYRAVEDVQFLRLLRDLRVLEPLHQPIELEPARSELERR
jgi:anti-sigma factor RsiW